MKVIKKRPEGITFLGWFLIALSFINFLIILIVQIDSGYGNDLQWFKESYGEDSSPAWLFIDVFIFLGLGIGLLNGKNWVRILTIVYFIFWIIEVIFTDLSSGDKVMWGLFWIVTDLFIILYLILNKRVKKFFTKE